ncbi:MAG: VTT domain-containing protein [Pseudomonadota bacterium]|nr:VTT domain-containing protein [Pseudomonadota bacterium]
MPDDALPTDLQDTPCSSAGGRPLLAPGRNCWRIEHAKRLTFLVDGANYFTAVRSALAKARHSIFILGWDIDSRMLLVPSGANDGYPEPLSEFLNAVVARRRGLRGYVLSWDYAMLYALEREWLPRYRFDWQTHRRLSFRLDARHPVAASHHQKVIVVDDSLAFVTGFDLTRCRWDTERHESSHPLRVDSTGKAYGPFHDVGVVVEGDCARALGELARDRWQRATGRAPRRPQDSRVESAWPDGVTPDIADVRVAIARTDAAVETVPPVTEIRQLHLDAIGAARRYVYAENQYFTSRTISTALARSLASNEGPDIAIVSPKMQSGWLESSTMGVLRARIHRDLRGADAHDRYRLYSPALPWLCAADGCLNVHSKVLIMDDDFVTIGSANLSDRSMNLDTECNLAIEAQGDPRVQAAITGFRDRLLAEHLGASPADVAAAIQSEGSLHRAIARLARPGSACLVAGDPDLDPMVDAVTPDHGILDPEEPLDTNLIMADVITTAEHRSGAKSRLAVLLVLVLSLAGLALAWRYTRLGAWLDFPALVSYAQWIERQPLAPFIVALAYLIGALLVIPVILLIAATTAVFGPALGALYSLAGALLSASFIYALGRHLGRDAVRKFAGPRLNELSRRLARRGLLAVVLIRIVPIAPFSVINAVAGASHIGWRDFILGTAVGLVPGIVLTSMFVDRAVAAMRSPSPTTFALLGGAAALVVAAALFVRRKLDHSAPPKPTQVSRNHGA